MPAALIARARFATASALLVAVAAALILAAAAALVPTLVAAARAPAAIAASPVRVLAPTRAPAAQTATAASPTPTPAPTRAVVRVRLRPDRPRALATLTVTIHYEDPQADVPAPLRRAVLRLPEGLGIEVPRLRSCPPAVLRARGPKACPSASRLGGGWAIATAHAGTQTLVERVSLTALLGPLVGLQPTFSVFAQGTTPFEQRVVLTGTVLPDAPPFGEDMAIAIPPIATLPLEPDASIAALSLSIGPRPGARARRANAVVVPARCPRGGLPFAVRSNFVDGSSSTASTFVPCL
jgi:hypothetical protein